MSEAVLCDLCGRTIPPHTNYVVRIEVFADPTLPPIGEHEFSETEYEKAVADLLAEMKDLSEDELQDQVYRQFAFRLCQSCQVRFLANPLGRPRDRHPGRN